MLRFIKLFILLLCCNFWSNAQIKIVCATPVHHFYVFQINGKYYSTGEWASLFLFRKKDLLKGRQYFGGKRLTFPFFKFISVPTRHAAYLENDKTSDTIYYKGIVLKYPLERDGVFDYATEENDSLIIVEHLRFVNQCKFYNKRHFECYTKH